MLLRLSHITKPEFADPPDHHVIAAAGTPPQPSSSWTSYLTFWTQQSVITDTNPATTNITTDSKPALVGFRNPWPSWQKATPAQIWDSFRWGVDDEGYLELAESHLTSENAATDSNQVAKLPRFGDLPPGWPGYSEAGAKAARLLRVEEPDFSLPDVAPAAATDDENPGKVRAKVTWLGHAGALVQFPTDPGDDGSGRPLAFLFDPIFSNRASPSESWGPARTYPPPCKVEDLPAIDGVLISHNHLDHMDSRTLKEVWEQNRESVRFFVPLGNGLWLREECGIPEERIVEMDWWDGVELKEADGDKVVAKVWCTPAQHNSWRSGAKNSVLWSSWYVEHLPADGNSGCKVFFAGDTGYQFHPSPSWPPSPKKYQHQASSDVVREAEENNAYPPCPAFAEIRDRLGAPDVLLLPVSVGATFSYLRSFMPLPNWINPLPWHGPGVTGANHMPSWDAVKVFKEMVGQDKEEGVASDGEGVRGGNKRKSVAVAIHWGTFVPDPEEVLRTLGELEWACKCQGVRFVRRWGVQEGGSGDELTFAALNHGGSIWV
jgi:N-acyl-phosphatidylethanolamine-hydrolysing phospholipase D